MPTRCRQPNAKNQRNGVMRLFLNFRGTSFLAFAVTVAISSHPLGYEFF